jgi:hypothetical protein
MDADACVQQLVDALNARTNPSGMARAAAVAIAVPLALGEGLARAKMRVLVHGHISALHPDVQTVCLHAAAAAKVLRPLQASGGKHLGYHAG